MGTSRIRRVQVSLSSAQRHAVGDRAERTGASLSSTVRELVAAALQDRAVEEADAADRALVGLGALVAAEHSLSLLELSFPALGRRSPELRQEAYASAQARLEELRRQLEASS